jgi:polysaccharide biosynthesis/export protein
MATRSSLRTRSRFAGFQALNLWLAVWPLLAQNAAPDAGKDTREPAKESSFRVHLKSRMFTSAEMLKNFDSKPSEAYQLGNGDEIALDVWGRPELSGKHQIGPDGRITLEIVGSIEVANLSREEAAAAVTKALSRLYSNVSVTIRVEKYSSNRIFILGRVANPGAILFDRSPTLLEAVTRAGGLPVGGLGAEKAALTRCAVFRGRDQVAWIDLRALLNGGNLALNLQLQRDDIVYIPDADDQLIYVLGEVKTPGALHLTPDMSFLDAIARSGGTTEDAATTKIHLVRPSQELNKEIRLDKLLHPDPTLNFALEEGDIVYVPRRALGTVGYVGQKIGAISGMVVVGSALGK